MKSKFFSTFSLAIKDFYENPFLILPPFCLFLFLVLFSYISKQVNYYLHTTLTISAWLVFFAAIFLFALSFTFSGLISISSLIAKNKPYSIKNFYQYAKKFTLRNFIIVIIMIIIYNITRLISHYTSLWIGAALNLELKPAQTLFISLYLILLLAFALFFTFSSFFMVIENLSIINSIKKSFSLVKRTYFQTLLITLVFFVIITLLNLLLPYKLFDFIYISELISTLLIYPYFVLVLTRFVLENS